MPKNRFFEYRYMRIEHERMLTALVLRKIKTFADTYRI